MKKVVLVLIAAAVMMTAVPSISQAEMGVGLDWRSNGFTPVMILPIKMQSGLILEPFLGFSITEVNVSAYEFTSMAASAQAESSPKLTTIDVGVRVEKEMNGMGAAKPVFGGFAAVSLSSPSDIFVGANEVDSWTDFQFGLYLGGSVALTEGLDMVGSWGPTFTVFGERSAGDVVAFDSATDISSMASVTFRWWLWGM